MRSLFEVGRGHIGVQSVRGPVPRRSDRPHVPLLVLTGALALVFSSVHAAAPQKSANPFENDSALLQRISVTAEGVSVQDLLAQITARTGVRLTAAAQAADDKVIAFSQKRPLSEFLSKLAVLFDDEWQRLHDRRGTYWRLVRRSGAADRERTLLQRRSERMLAHLERQVRALAENPEELQRREEQDAIRQALTREDGRLTTMLYGRLGRTQRESLFAQGELKLPFQALSPDEQRLVRQAHAAVVARDRKFLEGLADKLAQNGATPGSGNLQKSGDLDKVSGQLNYLNQPDRLDTDGVQFHLENSYGRVWVRARLGAGNDALMAELQGPEQWVLPVHGDPYHPASSPAAVTIPAGAHLEDVPAEKSWTDRLRRLSVASGLPVLADYYRVRPLAAPAKTQPGKATSPTEVLDSLAEAAGYLWWPHEDTLLFRKRDWYLQAAYEPPDRWLFPLARRLQAQEGVPSLQDVLALNALTPAQVAGFLALTGDSHREFDLDEPERAAALQVLRLAQGTTNDRQAPLVIHPWGPGPSGEQLARMRVRFGPLTREQQQQHSLFLRARTGLPPDGSPPELMIYICCRSRGVPPPPRTPLLPDRYGAAEVSVQWLQPVKDGNQLCSSNLFLRSIVPDDHTDATQVRVEP